MKKSIDAETATWLVRKVRHVCDGGRRGRRSRRTPSAPRRRCPACVTRRGCEARPTTDSPRPSCRRACERRHSCWVVQDASVRIAMSTDGEATRGATARRCPAARGSAPCAIPATPWRGPSKRVGLSRGVRVACPFASKRPAAAAVPDSRARPLGAAADQDDRSEEEDQRRQHA